MRLNKLEELKKASLVDIACEEGWVINRDKSCIKWISLDKDGRNMIVSKRSDHIDQFFIRGEETRGTVVDFLIKEVGKDLKSLMNFDLVLSKKNKREKVLQPVLIEKLDSVQLTKQEAYCTEKWFSIPFEPNGKDTYLERARKMPKRFLTQLYTEGWIKGDSVSAHFPLYEGNEKKKMMTIMSYYYEAERKESKKRFLAKAEKRGWTWLPVGDSILSRSSTDQRGTLIIAESPIDGLSYVVLNRMKDVIVMACGGEPSQVQLKQLSEITTRNRSVIIVGDNGKEGKRIASKLASTIPDTVSVKIDYPKGGKDFNEVLSSTTSLKLHI